VIGRLNKGDSIVKFHSPVVYAFALVASLLLAACGGGGAAGNPNQGGPISVSPENGFFFAGIPQTITLQGGRKPYSITSSDPALIEVPSVVDGYSFQVVPNNPGVVDPSTSTGQVPTKTVEISVRDSTGILVKATIQVAQNFLTAYFASFPTTSCPAAAGSSTGISPQAGCDVDLRFTSVISGNLVGDRQYRVEVVTGSFQFVNPLGTNTTTPTYTTTSDHQGNIDAIVRVPSGVPSQVGLVRLVDVQSGASNTYAFNITGATGATLTAIPSTFHLTGPDAQHCGTGSADVYIYGGAPPYAGVSTDPHILVTAVSPDTNPGQFRFSISDSSFCLNPGVLIFTDSIGNRVTVNVTTDAGSATSTALPLTLAPSTLTLGCNQSGTVAVVGGVGGYITVTSSPRVRATISGSTLTIQRLTADPPSPPAPIVTSPVTVFITDGTTLLQVSVTVPTSC